MTERYPPSGPARRARRQPTGRRIDRRPGDQTYRDSRDLDGQVAGAFRAAIVTLKALR